MYSMRIHTYAYSIQYKNSVPKENQRCTPGYKQLNLLISEGVSAKRVQLHCTLHPRWHLLQSHAKDIRASQECHLEIRVCKVCTCEVQPNTIETERQNQNRIKNCPAGLQRHSGELANEHPNPRMALPLCDASDAMDSTWILLGFYLDSTCTCRHLSKRLTRSLHLALLS